MEITNKETFDVIMISIIFLNNIYLKVSKFIVKLKIIKICFSPQWLESFLNCYKPL